jgi:hypothetical protein
MITSSASTAKTRCAIGARRRLGFTRQV